MKINVEPKGKYKAVICLEENYRWRKVCANHYTAGDFRSEDGVTPNLSLRNSEVYCETIHCNQGDDDRYRESPINHHNFGLLCWNELIEETNNFQI